jgi:hypothetical protein
MVRDPALSDVSDGESDLGNCTDRPTRRARKLLVHQPQLLPPTIALTASLSAVSQNVIRSEPSRCKYPLLDI